MKPTPQHTIERSNSHLEPHLEPRVAKLEVGMERLTEDVRSLVVVVREQGNQVEQEIQKLVVAVTQAAGPRKTDWTTIFAGVMLVMAIGSAVFWPLSQTSNDNKSALKEIGGKFDDHLELDLHPVGQALVNRLELQLKEHILDNAKSLEIVDAAYKERIILITKTLESEIKSLEKAVNLHNDRLYGRVVRLEETNSQDTENELAELRLWRLRAMSGEIQRLHNLPETGAPPAPAPAHNPVLESTQKK